MLQDPQGLPFTLSVVDALLRPESLSVAAGGFHRVAPAAPTGLPWYLRGAVRLGGAVAPVLPAPIVPLSRRALRDVVGHLLLDPRPARLTASLAAIRGHDARVDVRLLGERVLGSDAAMRRIDELHALAAREDVDGVTFTLREVVAVGSPWSFEDTVVAAVEQLLPFYAGSLLAGALPTARLTLEVPAHRDLDLTIAVFTRLLEDPALSGVDAAIALPIELPDTLPAVQQLTAWARERAAAGGSGIGINLIAGTDLAEEEAESPLHGWAGVVHATQTDVDASVLRILDWAITAENSAVRIGVSADDPLIAAFARELADERGVPEAVEVGVHLGVSPGALTALVQDVGSVRVDAPIAVADARDGTAAHVIRVLRSAAGRGDLSRGAERLDRARVRAADPMLPTGSRRTQDRALPPVPVEDTRIVRAPDLHSTAALTEEVMGIARASESTETSPIGRDGEGLFFGGTPFVETAVFATHEDPSDALGAPGFHNEADTDPSTPANREWSTQVLARVPALAAPTAESPAESIDAEAVLMRVRTAAPDWGSLPAVERAAVLRRAAAHLQEHRADLIAAIAAESGLPFAEADAEATRLIDAATYAASLARELDAIKGAVFVPAVATVVFAGADAAPAAGAADAFATIAAGSGTLLCTTAPAVGDVVAEALATAGLPDGVLVIARAEDAVTLAADPIIERVLFTGSPADASLLRAVRADLEISGTVSGRAVMIIMPSADLDRAAIDIARSAFARSGQGPASAGVAIVVGSAGRSRRLARQLADITRSLRAAFPEDPRADLGPLRSEPDEALERALTHLDPGERWLVEPRRVEARLWTPGVRTGVQPGAPYLSAAIAGPVLGVLPATTLVEAIRLHNEISAGGAASLHTRNPTDLARFLTEVEAGTLAINRALDGGVVQRRPLGGWGASAVGPAGRAGGPNRLVGLGRWRSSGGTTSSSTLHLKGLDSRITMLIEAAQPSLDFSSFDWLRRAALADAVVWDREFGRVKDVSRLGVERNLLRYRSVPAAVRATADATLAQVLRTVIAAIRARSAITLSLQSGLPAAVRHALGEQGVTVFMESDAEWCERLPETGVDRVRIVGPSAAEAAADLIERLGAQAPSAHIGEPTTSGRLELLAYLREQVISITAQRGGLPDPWSESVI